MSSVREGEDAFARIGEALDSCKVWQSGADPGASSAKSGPPPEPAGRGGSAFQDHAVKLEPPALQAPSGAECWVPNELISSCVATLLMIQVKRTVFRSASFFFNGSGNPFLPSMPSENNSAKYEWRELTRWGKPQHAFELIASQEPYAR